MKIKIITSIVFVFTTFACIDRFNPEIDDYVDLPVIEGTITNEPGPYIIKLSKTVTVNSLDNSPLTGATVVISDDLNNAETLTEIEPGSYTTSINGIQGIIGRKYKVTVSFENNTYQSDFEELQEPVNIDSIYSKIEYKESIDGTLEGLQFYINTVVPADKNYFILIVPMETYKYKADLKLDYILYGADSVVLVRNDSVGICWKTNRINEIFTFSTKSTNSVRGIPINYVDNTTKKLTERYYLLVKQYAISEISYNYWNEIKKQNDNAGSLYTSQPYQIRGNLKNIDDQNNVALGFFMVAGVSSKHIFVNSPDIFFNYIKCIPNISSIESLKDDLTVHYPLYATHNDEGIGLADLECFECRQDGGTIVKPFFWEE